MKNVCLRGFAALLSLTLVGQLLPVTGVRAQSSDVGTDIAITEEHFPDKAFRQWLSDGDNLQGYGADGLLTEEELDQITRIDVSRQNIADLTGIEYFTALEHLNCKYNRLTALDVSRNISLGYLDCSFNSISHLDVSGMDTLISLNCESNHLKSLKLDGCTRLEVLYSRNNDLQVLELSTNTALKFIETFDNQLKDIDLSELTQLEFVHLDHNRFETLDLSANTNLSPIGSGFVARNNFLNSLTLPVSEKLWVSPDVYAEQDPKIGYERVEWYADSGFQTPITDEVQANGQTLYAKWLPNDYTIYFDANGGSGAVYSQSAVWDQALDLTPNRFTRRGYTFLRWEDTYGDGSHYADGENVTNLAGEIQGDRVTLYAQWRPITYQVAYHANGGSGSMAASEHTYDQSKALPTCTLTAPEGKVFAGWALSAGGSVRYLDGASVQNLTTVDGDTVDLYAVWQDDARTEYLNRLLSAFSRYEMTDYTTADWTVLSALYDQAVEKVSDPGNSGSYDAICADAEAAMAAVPTVSVRAEEVVSAWEAAHAHVLAMRTNRTLDEANAADTVTQSQQALSGLTTDLVANTCPTLTDSADQEVVLVQAADQAAETFRTLRQLQEAAVWASSLDGLSDRPMTEVTSQSVPTYEDATAQSASHDAFLSARLTDALAVRLDLSKAKQQAITDLHMTYRSYDLSLYSAKGQASLRAVLDSAVSDLERAASADAVTTRLAEARQALAAVPTQAQENQPDGGGNTGGGSGGGGTGGGAGGGGSIGGGSGGGSVGPVPPETENPDVPEDEGLLQWKNPFADVTADAWYFAAVRYAAYHGLMEGVASDTFSPDGTLTRAQLAQILYNLEGRPAADSVSGNYGDVADGAWYEDAVSWAVRSGILTGYTGGSIGPDRSITREQLAAMLYRYAGMKGQDTGNAADLSGYADADAVSDYAREPLRWAVAAGILNGTGANALTPAGNATRAQASAMLMRYLEQ